MEQYPTVVLRGTLEDMGEVKLDTISDGYDEFKCRYVELADEVRFCEINGKYYIDRPHEIKRVTEDLIMKYKLDKYVYIEGQEAPLVKKKRGRTKKV